MLAFSMFKFDHKINFSFQIKLSIKSKKIPLPKNWKGIYSFSRSSFPSPETADDAQTSRLHIHWTLALYVCWMELLSSRSKYLGSKPAIDFFDVS